MRKVTLVLVMTLMSLVSFAQQDAVPVLKYGYLSYDSVFQAMPEYATMQASIQQLRDKYEAEQKRVEDDFNKKYEEFLDGQASFPKTILQKRQSELQEMLDKNIAFKKESQRLLCKAECEAKAPLKNRLAEVLAKIGEERGYVFILNTDGNVAPWLNTAMGEDITEIVKELLK
jgi:outer membrane protein